MGSHHLSVGGYRYAGAVTLVAVTLMAAGCASAPDRIQTATRSTSALPRSLIRQVRPIGRGPAFHPPVRGRPLGPCRSRLGRRHGAHVELFAANRVVLIAARIGARPPVRRIDGRIISARCFGALVTRDATGIILIRPHTRLTIGDLMRSWGQPLGTNHLLSFHGTVTAYVDGRRWTTTPPADIPLTRHAEIVLEIGPHVPPHRSFTFPPGT